MLFWKHKNADSLGRVFFWVEPVAKFPSQDKKPYMKSIWQLRGALHLKNIKTGMKSALSWVAKPVWFKNSLTISASHYTRLGEMKNKPHVFH